MLDNVTINFRVNKIHMPNVKSAESALLTIERAQKLDLLIHLITNLRQSLVICGPNGIGKTTLVAELKKCEKDGLPVLSIPASSNLSFESFQNQLTQLVIRNLDFHVENQDISAILSLFEKKNHKIVIIIDEAGQLVPGLIGALIQYANENKCLRIIFSLTLDEILLKNSSDRVIEDCHFIEIPPLTKKQCGVFLQNLSARPGTALSFNDVTIPLVEHFYKKTHGIPGALISEVDKGVKGTAINMERYKWIGFALIAGIVVTLSGFLMIDESSQEDKGEKKNSYQVTQETEESVITDPYVQYNEEGTSQIKAGVDNVDEKQGKEDFSQYNEQKEAQVTEINESDVAEVTKEISPEEVAEHITEVPTVVVQNIDKKPLDSDLPFTKPIKKPERQIGVRTDKVEASQAKEDFFQQIEQEKNTSVQNVIKKNKVAETTIGNDVSHEQDLILEKTIKQPIKDSEVGTVVTKSKDTIDKKKEKPIRNVIAKKDDNEWILKQPENYYTMQLIVLSKREAVTGFLKDYPKLLEDLKFFQKRKQGGEQFVVIYGSFKDAATTSKKMKSLPPRFRNAWVRSFGGLHKMVKK